MVRRRSVSRDRSCWIDLGNRLFTMFTANESEPLLLKGLRQLGAAVWTACEAFGTGQAGLRRADA